MRPSSTLTALAVCAFAALVWGLVYWFDARIDASARTSAEAISKARQENVRRDEGSAAIALAAATADGRAQLSSVVNKDALSLSNAITEAGKDAGVEITIGNVSQGPVPALPKGAVLHPAAITFSVNAVGSFQKLFTLTSLLSDLSAASSLEHLQLSHGSESEGWRLNADIRVITNSPI